MGSKPRNDALRIYAEVLLDEELRALRKLFCRTAATSLQGIASWLGLDSWLGAGDHGPSGDAAAGDSERYFAFRAAAAVIEMAGELAGGAVSLLENDQRFAAAALIRQLLETEYLLRAFSVDFTQASTWARSTPYDIRRSFSPRAMRTLGGFSNPEYWRHCDMGGHPAPSGRALLHFNLATPPSADEFLSASVWGDLAQHLRRLWVTTDELLRREHARYEDVRKSDYAPVWDIMERWIESDPLASEIDFRVVEGLTTP